MTESENQTRRAMRRSFSGGVGGGCLGVVIGFLLFAFLVPTFLFGQAHGSPSQPTGTPLDILTWLVDLVLNLVFVVSGLVGAIIGGVVGSIAGSLFGVRTSTAPEPPDWKPDEKMTKHE